NNDIVLYSAFQDITLRKRHETVLQSQADRDPLTSVYNRRYFESKVIEKIKNAHVKNNPFAIFMIDADKFKNINDKFGHKIGDKVLIELASVCERSLRQEDIVARYGGEEFVAFIDNVDLQTAITVANRLKKSIADIVVYAEDKIPVTVSVSIGIAVSGVSDNVPVMIKMADDAMYLAKQNGRNRVEVYDKEKMEKVEIDERVSQKSQMHPAFFGEESNEISLLDGIESASIIED
ncbi:GGDEF domain-containing protein, partial [bacterium]|nr:GGDEF domain-containing protein [bacterium]